MVNWKKRLKKIFYTNAGIGSVIGVTGESVSQWRHGVPKWHVDKIIAAAKEKGYTLTEKQLRS